jgi:DNA-binding NtrC family response regulator
MKSKKKELFSILNKRDMDLFSLETDAFSREINNSEKLNKIKINDELFNQLKKIPSWPFNLRTLTKLLYTMIIPTIPVILQILIKVVMIKG